MKTVPPSEVPEVEAYLEAQEMFDVYCASKPEVIATLRTLIEDMNTKAQAADKAVRSLGVFCGPWKKHNTSVQYNIDQLVEGVGIDEFLKLGGESHTQVSYHIDKNRIEVAIGNGSIPRALVPEIRTEKISYSKPKEKAL